MGERRHKHSPLPAAGESLRWFTSSHSAGGSCVEVAITTRRVLVRDSKNRDNGALSFGPAAWAVFIQAVKADRISAGFEPVE